MKAVDLEIIDCHIHPPGFPAADMSWFYPAGSIESFITDMQVMGVDRACGSIIVREIVNSYDQVAALNRAAYELSLRFPDFYIPALQIDPRFPDESCREIEFYVKEKGVRWIGELVGEIMGYGEGYLQPGSEPVYELAAQLGVPVDVHCEDLEMLHRLCTTFPRLTLVLAHPEASRDLFLARLNLMERHPNLYLDLSGSGVMRWGLIRKAVDTVGAKRILFGTDFPICNPAMYIHCVMSERISDRDREDIFSGNFKRLTNSPIE